MIGIIAGNPLVAQQWAVEARVPDDSWLLLVTMQDIQRHTFTSLLCLEDPNGSTALRELYRAALGRLVRRRRSASEEAEDARTENEFFTDFDTATPGADQTVAIEWTHDGRGGGTVTGRMTIPATGAGGGSSGGGAVGGPGGTTTVGSAGSGGSVSGGGAAGGFASRPPPPAEWSGVGLRTSVHDLTIEQLINTIRRVTVVARVEELRQFPREVLERLSLNCQEAYRAALMNAADYRQAELGERAAENVAQAVQVYRRSQRPEPAILYGLGNEPEAIAPPIQRPRPTPTTATAEATRRAEEATTSARAAVRAAEMRADRSAALRDQLRDFHLDALNQAEARRNVRRRRNDI